MRIRSGLLLATFVALTCLLWVAERPSFDRTPETELSETIEPASEPSESTEPAIEQTEPDLEAEPEASAEAISDPSAPTVATAPSLKPEMLEVDAPDQEPETHLSATHLGENDPLEEDDDTAEAPQPVLAAAPSIKPVFATFMAPAPSPKPDLSEADEIETETETSHSERERLDDEEIDDADDILEAAPKPAYSVEHVDMVIEGTIVSIRSRHRGEEDRQFNLTDIAEALGSRTELHETLLGYHRAQDGTLMSINMEDGKVRSNRTVLGRLPDFEPREAADPWISLNAVTIMTGTHPSEDEQGRTVLSLDDQLRPQFGLELWVNGELIDTFGREPRTIGSILLVPLEPVVEALGHELSQSNGTVTVRRQQDQATIHLELATGLVSVNTTPRGVTPDMQLAERDTLVLPFGAVEALTGTHIRLVPLTNRVEVNLDNRLDSQSLPGAEVSEQARKAPLTLESLTYQMSDHGPLRTELRGHVSTYNFRAQLETAGGLDTLASTQTGWASLDLISLHGWQATIGDYTSGFRELAGVGANRIRGASWRKQRKNGAILALAGGMPLTGATASSDSVSVPTFGGFAAGGRLISQDQLQDIGVSAAISADGANASVVANGQKSFRFDNQGDGLQSAYIAADLGVFTGDASGADIRLRGSANYAASSQIGVSASGSYDGASFAAGAAQPSLEGVFKQRNGARTNLSVGANWRADQPLAVFNRLGISSRVSMRHQGGDNNSLSTTANLAVTTQIGESGPNVSANLQRTAQSGSGEDTSSSSFRLRGVQRFDIGSVTASYAHAQSNGAAATQQLIATAQLNPIRRRFENGLTVQVAPNATLNWDGEQTRVNMGASALANSGNLFGPKLNVDARLSAFSNFSADEENANTTRFLGSLEARYRVAKNAELTAIYTDDFNGRSDLSIGLRGTLVFNPPRASRLPDDGKGVLNGRVFLDKNRDGIRQDDEPGIPGVRVTLMGTRVGLNSGANGYFTIQNVNQGLYAVTVSRQSLPLGYLVPEGSQPRVTVGSGRRTDVEVPLILSGQIRGAVFIDDNANGTVDPGEQRLEGQWISLIPQDGGDPLTIHSASFGQYGFESVNPGIYTLQTTVSGQPVRQEITVDGNNPFVIAPIPIPPDLADNGGGVDLSAGVIGEP